MLYKICGGLFFLLTGINMLVKVAVPPVIIGLLALLAGIGLLAGI